MSQTIDPNAQPVDKPVDNSQPTTALTADNDNLVLISLADLNIFLQRFTAAYSDDPYKSLILDFVEDLIASIEEDKQQQLEEAKKAMEKFNP